MPKSKLKRANTHQLPLQLSRVRKSAVRTQFAALCWRMRKDKVQICLITSRETKRWILPKGWPMHNQTPAEAAATEAWEEAGLTGKTIDQCLGVYTYIKKRPSGNLPIITLVYPLKVRNVHSEWPEARERKRRWMTLSKASRKLREPALQRIVANFDPALLKN